MYIFMISDVQYCTLDGSIVSINLTEMQKAFINNKYTHFMNRLSLVYCKYSHNFDSIEYFMGLKCLRWPRKYLEQIFKLFSMKRKFILNVVYFMLHVKCFHLKWNVIKRWKNNKKTTKIKNKTNWHALWQVTHHKKITNIIISCHVVARYRVVVY